MRPRRQVLLPLIAAGAIVFVAVSFVLANALGVSGAERSAVTTLVTAEVRGDGSAVAHGLSGCGGTAACAARGAALAARLRRAGAADVLAFDPTTEFALVGGDGVARVAWHVGSRGVPVVQCAHVHLTGNALSGLHVDVSALSDPIKSDSSCPGA